MDKKKISYPGTRVLAVALAWPLSIHAQTTTPPPTPATPIQHVVVIFDENNSFDHYFGTYPNATNPKGEPQFTPLANTPTVNGLTPSLIANNPNSTKPFRLDRANETLCDNDNHYTDEQNAYDSGLLDKFPESTNGTGCPAGSNMGYYDGNTVTALWNYAQHFAMSDNFYDTEYGTTVMGHLNLISVTIYLTNQTKCRKIVSWRYHPLSKRRSSASPILSSAMSSWRDCVGRMVRSSVPTAVPTT
jgi:phospholipase C